MNDNDLTQLIEEILSEPLDKFEDTEVEKLDFREIVATFLHTTIHEIKSESETPNVNFLFETDENALFDDIVKHPFDLENRQTGATQEDIKYLLERSNDECPTIHVKDSFTFFKYLTDITKAFMKLYGRTTSPRNYAIQIMRRIWLRMGITDFENVELFLKRQLEFLNNRRLDTEEEQKIDTFHDYDVFMETFVNRTWDESTRRMIFTIKNDTETYELPHILYDIDDSDNCYIYGIQSSQSEKSKHIERKLYKLNKGIDNPNVHPSKVFALILFIKQLEKHGISKITVPGMQVLSYRYHELISQKVEKELKKAKEQIEQYPNNIDYQKQFQEINEWYNRTHNKEELISYLKTEELINLMYRLTKHNPNIEITNEINIQGDSLNLKIR